MKVKALLAILQKADPEFDVCIFSEAGVVALPSDGSDVNVYEGEYETDMLPKLAPVWKQGRYVGLGNPGDFDDLAPDSVCHLVEELLDTEEFDKIYAPGKW